jgi:hypothetical protein
MEIGDDERYQRDYLYRRGGIPKGGAGHHVERMYLLRGVSFLDLPSSLLFYERKKANVCFSGVSTSSLSAHRLFTAESPSTILCWLPLGIYFLRHGWKNRLFTIGKNWSRTAYP